MKKTSITINLDIEKLPEGWYLATSPDVKGLVAQEKTFEKVVETAKELSQILLAIEKKEQRLHIPNRERVFYPVELSV